MKRSIGWSITFIFCLSLACTIPALKPSVPPRPSPAGAKMTKAADGLIITDAGIDFDDTHHCVSSYASQTSDMTNNERRQRTGYTIETTCTTTGETHTQMFSEITYNQLGQRDGYQLKLSCSRTGKSYAIAVSQIIYDNNWQVLSYAVDIDGTTYYYKR